MSDWMTIRVVLAAQSGLPLPQPPGRVLLAHGDHTFAELAEAIDAAFGRWDLTPLHLFEVDGRTLVSAEADGLEDHEESDELTLAEAGLRVGTRFAYTFDIGEGWEHDCRVEEVDVELDELGDDEPEVPVPVYGWGRIPDQYGVDEEDRGDDDEPEDDEDADEADQAGDGGSARAGLPEDVAADTDDEDTDDDDTDDEDVAATWDVVAAALADLPRDADDAALAAAVADLRAEAGGSADVLWAAADLDPDDAPDDDAEVWTELAAGVVVPDDDVPVDDDALAAWTSLEAADWAGAVIELSRSGVGTVASPEALIELIARCPEIEGDELSEDDEAVILEGLEVVVALWRALGALDDDGALTPLGLWGLPRALERAWVG
jgi:hypothetical protein